MFWLARRVNANLAQQESETQKPGPRFYKPLKFSSRKLNRDRNRYGNVEFLVQYVSIKFFSTTDLLVNVFKVFSNVSVL